MLSYIGIAFYVIASQHENLKLFMTVLNSNTKQKTSFLSCKICQIDEMMLNGMQNFKCRM